MINVAVTNPDLQRFIEEQLRAGTFASADDIVAAGLLMLQQDPDANLPPEELEGLRHEISIGIDQADRGQYSDFTAEDVIAEGRAKLRNRSNGK